jgi:hypothetical protein
MGSLSHQKSETTMTFFKVPVAAILAIWNVVIRLYEVVFVNRREIAALKAAQLVQERQLAELLVRLKELENNHSYVQNETTQLRRDVAFLQASQDIHKLSIEKIYELQALGNHQELRLSNLEEEIERDLFPRIEDLEAAAPTADEQKEMAGVRRRLRNNITRARKRVAA